MSTSEPQAETIRFAPTCMPEPAKPPTMAAILELAERARAGFLAERARLVDAITTAVEAAGLTIVRTDPVEEVAAHPAAVHRLRGEIFAQSAQVTRNPLPGQIGSLTDLPVIPDNTLLQDVVHLRPYPNRHGVTE